MVVCSQCFLNEIDILEIKLNELKDAVDLFVVLEADRSFTGMEKRCHFSDNSQRFSGFNIHHEIVHLPKFASSAWQREGVHRDGLVEITDNLTSDGDTIIWVDTDEIPRANIVSEFSSGSVGEATLQMDYLAFYFDRIKPDLKWTHPKIFRKEGKFCRPVRYTVSPVVIPDSGWHFEFCGSMEMLLSKISSTSHFEKSRENGFYESVRNGQKPGLECTVQYPVEKLPKYVQENQDKFRQYFKQ
jgi:beta-1,4-mannosyl-glycoprotein beta-1,4-N-acetylglucosaminyltransferase